MRPFLLPSSDERRQHAHRVYLVVPGIEGARGFPERIQDALKAQGIEVMLRVVDRVREGRNVEFESTVEAVAAICHREAFRDDNEVHINMSSGSKIGALASSLGGMAYQQTGNVRLYYVEPEDYLESIEDEDERRRVRGESGLSRGLRNVLPLQVIPLIQYDRPVFQLLAFLRRSGGVATNQEVLEHLIAYPEGELSEFADLLSGEVAKEAGLEQTELAASRSRRGAPTAKLREMQNKALGRLRTMTEKLDKDGWLRVERRRGKHRLRLTEAGKILALLSQDESRTG